MNLAQKLFLGLAIVSTLSQCKEQEPSGLYYVAPKPLLDSTYTTSTVPAAQTKRVMIFDITGVRCSNCPKAAELAAQISASNPGRVQIVALYADVPGLGQLTDSWDAYPRVNSQFSTDLVAKIGNPQSLPTGSIDQVTDAGSTLIPITKWAGLVTNRLALSTPVNIDVTATYTAATQQIRVNSTATFTGASTDSFTMYVALIEDDIESKQSDNRVGSGHIDDYIHKHVLRYLYTGASGSNILSNGNINAGFTAEKHYQTTRAGAWNAAHLHAVVWLVSRSTKEIVHVQETKVQ